MFGFLSSQFLDHLRPLFFFRSGHSNLICCNTQRKDMSQTLLLSWAELVVGKKSMK